jgi:hypothetical protein
MPPQFADAHRIAPNRPGHNRNAKFFHNLTISVNKTARNSSGTVVRQGSRKLHEQYKNTDKRVRLEMWRPVFGANVKAG